MSKQSGEEQEGSFEEDMKAFFESATFEEKPKRKRKPRERKYKRGRKEKKEPKEQKGEPAPLSTDMQSFFGTDNPENQGESKSEKGEDKDTFEENLRGFFRDAMFEEQIRHNPDFKAESFACPHCGTRLSMSVDTCVCGAAFVEEDKVIEAEITEFLDELAQEEELEGAEEETEDEKGETEDEGLGTAGEPEGEIKAEEVREDEVEVGLTVTTERLRRDRICFYVGSILLLLGGPIIAFGSWLHDWFMVPIVGTKYDAFGWVNVTYAEVGLFILIIGIVLFAISLRGGVITRKELEKLKAES